MKLFACGDVVPGCATTWMGSDEEEILLRVQAHVREVHGIDEIPRSLVAAVRTHMVSAP